MQQELSFLCHHRSPAEHSTLTIFYYRDLERDIAHLEGVVSKDYGPEEEFAALSGQCYEYTDQEYTYKLCAFDYCSQRPNSQGKYIYSKPRYRSFRVSR